MKCVCMDVCVSVLYVDLYVYMSEKERDSDGDSERYIVRVGGWISWFAAIKHFGAWSLWIYTPREVLIV